MARLVERAPVIQRDLGGVEVSFDGGMIRDIQIECKT
jgi:hypothetical protein